MDDSLMPGGRGGGNKAIAVLIAGSVALATAGGVYLFQSLRSASKPSVPLTSDNEPIKVKTLVAPPPTSLPETPPSIGTDREPDTSPAEPSAENETKKTATEEFGGTIDTKQVNAYINGHFDQVRACYERRLKINSLLEGRLDLNIVVSTSGKVSAIRVNSDTVRDATMLDCVKKTIRTWELPKPEGGRVVIGKTFNFKKKE